MPKRLVPSDDLAAFASAVQAENQTTEWAVETEVVRPMTQPAPDFAWSAESDYDTQDWPDEAWRDDSESSAGIWQAAAAQAAPFLFGCSVVMVIVAFSGLIWLMHSRHTHDDGQATAETGQTVISTRTPAASWTPSPSGVPIPYCAPGHNADTGCLPVVVATPPPVTPTGATPIVSSADLARNLSDALARNVRRPHSVSCPANLRGIVGASERCTLTDNGVTFGVTVTVKTVDGNDVETDYLVDQGWPN